MIDFFNTTRLNGEELKESVVCARSQEDKIICFFREAKCLLSPSMIFQYVVWPTNTPITSIRRAISNLTRKGVLVKTTKRVRGMYNRLEFCWGLL